MQQYLQDIQQIPPTCTPRRQMPVLANIACGRLSWACCSCMGSGFFYWSSGWCIIFHGMDFSTLLIPTARWINMLNLYAGLDFVTFNYGTTSLPHHTKLAHNFDMLQLFPSIFGQWMRDYGLCLYLIRFGVFNNLLRWLHTCKTSWRAIEQSLKTATTVM